MQKMKMHTSSGSKIHKVHKGIAQVCITAEIHGEIHEIIEATEALFIQQRQEHVASVVVGQIAQHHLGVIKVSRSSRSIQIRLPCLLFTSVSFWIACIAYIAFLASEHCLLANREKNETEFSASFPQDPNLA